ncbi:4ET-like protein [Mya arenaria]|uniref:4ET-like protein n=1 Tax=Mya arenaria TaxID=6604 RepID=A0ABY7E3T4_MYAAR|nr:4ET-like protein [Mya arenaria]
MDRESDRGSSEAGSGRATPRSLDQENLRSDTPGTMPTYIYSMDELYDLRSSPISNTVPDCLEKDFIVDGVWDPEKWHRSFGGGGNTSSRGGSRGPSPLAIGETRERKDMFRKNSGSERSLDPKERLKEEKDAIVLSPQRRSFGTGCHVSQQPLLQRAISNIEVERDRRERRIGSGRIQIDRDRPRERSDSDYRAERNERHHDKETREYREKDTRDFRDKDTRDFRDKDPRDFRDLRDFRDKDPRDFRSSRDIERDRDFRNPRYDRDDRNRRYDRERLFATRDQDDRTHRDRDFRDHGGSRYNRHHRHEEEPEWFSSGPISKTDTIELHGFERERRDSDRVDDSSGQGSRKKRREERRKEEVADERVGSDTEEHHEGISVADRNGSLETNESSSPETNDADHPPRKSPSQMAAFDFNDFYNSLSIPGLANKVPEEIPEKADMGFGGSRFSHMFRGSGNEHQSRSRENSLRSTAIDEDEFGYLNASGMKNSPIDSEAKLKALLFGRIDSNSSSGNTTPGFNSPLSVPGKVKTVAELEGELQRSREAADHRSAQRPSPHAPHGRVSPQGDGSDLTAFNKLISLMQAGEARPIESPNTEMTRFNTEMTKFNKLISLMQAGHVKRAESPKMTQMKGEVRGGSPVTNIPSALQQGGMTLHGGPHPGMQTHPTPQQGQQPIHGRMINKADPTMNMQAHLQRGNMDEVQFEMMDGFHGNMMPPNANNMNDAAAAQKQFFDAIQRNKEEQLQKRQAAIHNMRFQHQITPGHQHQMNPGQPNNHLAQQQQQQAGSQERRSSTGDPIMNFLKANPTIITKPASPTPPPQQQQPAGVSLVNLVPQIQPSPRGPSPSPSQIQSALLQRQAPGTPRVPSPIMFSQQPPTHLSAPSPIHPVQGGSQSPVGPASSSTQNTIRPPLVPRQPSPQELIVHTQAILQNALIKKQLEDQKERFYKKQQERVKSPNPGNVAGIPMSVLSMATPTAAIPPAASTSTPTKAPVNVAFTPTSVIRKMHSEKAEEKEKLRRDSVDVENSELREDQVAEGRSTVDPAHSDQYPSCSMPSSLSAAPPTSIPPPSMIHAVPPPPLPNKVLPNLVSVLPPGATVIPGILPPFNSNHLTHLPPPPPLVSTHLPPPLLSPGVAALAPLPPPLTQSTHDQIDAVKTQQLRALLGQQSPGIVSAGMAVVTSALSAMGRPIVKGGRLPMQTSAMLGQGQLGNTGSSPILVQQMMQGAHPRDGPISPGQLPVSMGGKPDNLMKWFGSDVLKTSLTTMPPLPVQGQRVLTLDEIERFIE